MKKPISSCHCECIDMGSYDNQIVLKIPYKQRSKLGEKEPSEFVSIDTCIAGEIGFLWHHGVETLNSCCGHGVIEASVIVTKRSVPMMELLGYKKSKLKSALPEQTFVIKLTKSK